MQTFDLSKIQGSFYKLNILQINFLLYIFIHNYKRVLFDDKYDNQICDIYIVDEHDKNIHNIMNRKQRPTKL